MQARWGLTLRAIGTFADDGRFPERDCHLVRQVYVCGGQEGTETLTSFFPQW